MVADSWRKIVSLLMIDVARHRFDVVAVAGFDRMARCVRHLLETLDELHRLNIEFLSLRENIDRSGPLAELERSLIIERVRAGMRRALLAGTRIGRRPLELDRAAILRERQLGRSLGELAKIHRVSRTTIRRVLAGVPKGLARSSS